MVEVVTLWSFTVQPFFVIRKSCNNSYELFYMSGNGQNCYLP
jgi:hypothetical protein